MSLKRIEERWDEIGDEYDYETMADFAADAIPELLNIANELQESVRNMRFACEIALRHIDRLEGDRTMQDYDLIVLAIDKSKKLDD